MFGLVVPVITGLGVHSFGPPLLPQTGRCHTIEPDSRLGGLRFLWDLDLQVLCDLCARPRRPQYPTRAEDVDEFVYWCWTLRTLVCSNEGASFGFRPTSDFRFYFGSFRLYFHRRPGTREVSEPLSWEGRRRSKVTGSTRSRTPTLRGQRRRQKCTGGGPHRPRV